jgi:hypothetical protein
LLLIFPGREFNKPGRKLWSTLPFDVPAADGFVAGTHGSRISVTVVINVASRQERPNGRGKDSKQILIIERTKKKVSESGNKKIQATGSGIVGDIQSTANTTGKHNGSGIGTGVKTRPAMIIL